jgi:hypothetical protein
LSLFFGKNNTKKENGFFFNAAKKREVCKEERDTMQARVSGPAAPAGSVDIKRGREKGKGRRAFIKTFLPQLANFATTQPILPPTAPNASPVSTHRLESVNRPASPARI